MVLLAFSLQDQVDKFGAYVGIAAFFGLAILTLLYFAQAREVKRLREWAGRAPERAAELEQAVLEHAEAVRQATPVPAAQPAVAVATNGVVKLKPAELAALAFARAAGVREPHLPKAQPAPVALAEPPAEAEAEPAAEAPPAEVAAAGAAVATGEPAAAQSLNGGNGDVPAPATPAARRAESPPVPPLPPRRAAAAAAVASRRPAPAPARSESNTRAIVVTAVVGVLVLAGAAFGLTRLLGGEEEAPPPPNVVATATAEGGAQATATASAAPQLTKDNVLVGVYNGTTQEGLAGTNRDVLVGEGYPTDNLGADTAPADLQRQTSVVLYARGAKPAAQQVADVLGITDVKQIDSATQALIAKSPKKWNVVAIVGADKTN